MRLDPLPHRGAELLIVVLPAVPPQIRDRPGAVRAAEVRVLLAEEDARLLPARERLVVIRRLVLRGPRQPVLRDLALARGGQDLLRGPGLALEPVLGVLFS